MIKRMAAGLLVSTLMAGAAFGEVVASAPDGFVIQAKGEVALDRDTAWARLLQISLWWPDDHTWSGNAEALYIDPVVGGCWCELWPGGEVEHGRVIHIRTRDIMRFNAPLGPLQGMGVSSVVTFTLGDGATDGTTSMVADMVVNGSSLSKLDQIAPVVDRVFSGQVGGFLKLD